MLSRQVQLKRISQVITIYNGMIRKSAIFSFWRKICKVKLSERNYFNKLIYAIYKNYSKILFIRWKILKNRLNLDKSIQLKIFLNNWKLIFYAERFRNENIKKLIFQKWKFIIISFENRKKKLIIGRRSLFNLVMK